MHFCQVHVTDNNMCAKFSCRSPDCIEYKDRLYYSSFGEHKSCSVTSIPIFALAVFSKRLQFRIL